jgi:ATP-dependent Clp protease ATP-binding subunit ClpC
LTPRARQAICLAAEEAQRAGRVAYGSEHLLIGLLRTNEGMGFQMLGSLGVGLDAMRAKIAPDCADATSTGHAEGSDQSK